MTEFKVGMRVKNINSGYTQEFGPEEGLPVAEGTVTGVVEGGLDVNWDGIGRPLFCFEREVRHIPDPIPVVETEDHLEDESGFTFEDTDEDLAIYFGYNGFSGNYSGILEDGDEDYQGDYRYEDQSSGLTGGPTSYYDFPDDWVTLNDLMDYKAKNQWGPLSFHMGNITKATYRFGEKDGTSKEYDVNKIIYSGLRAKLMLEDKQSVREYLEELLNDPQFN